MTKISKLNKLKIFRLIVDSRFFDKLYNQEQTLPFLNSIWKLEQISSTDPRFEDFSGDVQQHFINNADWTADFLFLDRLDLLSDSEVFVKFVEAVVDNYYNDNSDIGQFVKQINVLLNKDGYALFRDNDSCNYSIIKSSDGNSLQDSDKNKIIFILKTLQEQKKMPLTDKEFPVFILEECTWDDFGVRSQFELTYIKNSFDIINIGFVKIIHETEKHKTNMYNKYLSYEYLPNQFQNLSSDFCSLGQSQSYYDNLKRTFPDSYSDILYALRDCAVFPIIEDDFREHVNFHSLIRDDVAEKLLREEKYIIIDQFEENRYQFKYKFIPKYSLNEAIYIDFKFDSNSALPNRMYGIIGENGVGKTQLITNLPLDISRKCSTNFSPRIPIFSKVIAVSNSYYDNFRIPTSSGQFNYRYCGLTRLDNGVKRVMLPDEMEDHLKKACELIDKRDRILVLKKILEEVIDEYIMEDLFKINAEGTKLVFNLSQLPLICKRISSGQNILLNVFCNIISNIRYDSLLLFDEPETHLHPNAITTLMTGINDILEKYQSYAIITTHSPLIIREIFSKNVYVMERNDTYPQVRKIGLESFGENLTVLTEEVFGNKKVDKYYKKVITELVDKGNSYQSIVDLLKSDSVPLSLNVTLFVKCLVNIRDAKN